MNPVPWRERGLFGEARKEENLGRGRTHSGRRIHA
jgi:hypothetical protein